MYAAIDNYVKVNMEIWLRPTHIKLHNMLHTIPYVQMSNLSQNSVCPMPGQSGGSVLVSQKFFGFDSRYPH